MSYVTLAKVKQHLNIDSAFTADDALLTDLIGVAECAVQNHIDRNLESMEDEDGNIPAPLCHAIKLLIGTLYRDREATAEKATSVLECSYDYLLSQYRKMTTA